jgi:hypothetical protein
MPAPSTKGEVDFAARLLELARLAVEVGLCGNRQRDLRPQASIAFSASSIE